MFLCMLQVSWCEDEGGVAGGVGAAGILATDPGLYEYHPIPVRGRQPAYRETATKSTPRAGRAQETKR